MSEQALIEKPAQYECSLQQKNRLRKTFFASQGWNVQPILTGGRGQL